MFTRRFRRILANLGPLSTKVGRKTRPSFANLVGFGGPMPGNYFGHSRSTRDPERDRGSDFDEPPALEMGCTRLLKHSGNTSETAEGWPNPGRCWLTMGLRPRVSLCGRQVPVARAPSRAGATTARTSRRAPLQPTIHSGRGPYGLGASGGRNFTELPQERGRKDGSEVRREGGVARNRVPESAPQTSGSDEKRRNGRLATPRSRFLAPDAAGGIDAVQIRDWWPSCGRFHCGLWARLSDPLVDAHQNIPGAGRAEHVEQTPPMPRRPTLREPISTVRMAGDRPMFGRRRPTFAHKFCGTRLGVDPACIPSSRQGPVPERLSTSSRASIQPSDDPTEPHLFTWHPSMVSMPTMRSLPSRARPLGACGGRLHKVSARRTLGWN